MRLGCTVLGVGKDGDFCVETSQGPVYGTRLVLATGGLSIPKMGASGFAYEVARQFGLKVTETRPGLVPLTIAASNGPGCRG